MKQEEREVTYYYIEMKASWQELDLLTKETWKCSGDSVKYTKKLEDEHVYQFLAGLNRTLVDVRSRILSHKSLPTTCEVCSKISREENQCHRLISLI